MVVFPKEQVEVSHVSLNTDGVMQGNAFAHWLANIMQVPFRTINYPISLDFLSINFILECRVI